MKKGIFPFSEGYALGGSLLSLLGLSIGRLDPPASASALLYFLFLRNHLGGETIWWFFAFIKV